MTRFGILQLRLTLGLRALKEDSSRCDRIKDFNVAGAPNLFVQFNGSVTQHDLDFRFTTVGVERPKHGSRLKIPSTSNYDLHVGWRGCRNFAARNTPQTLRDC